MFITIIYWIKKYWLLIKKLLKKTNIDNLIFANLLRNNFEKKLVKLSKQNISKFKLNLKIKNLLLLFTDYVDYDWNKINEILDEKNIEKLIKKLISYILKEYNKNF